MAVVPNATLDALLDFVILNSNGYVASVVLFTYSRAPAYTTTGANTYIPDNRIYITGAEDPANNGMFIIGDVITAGYPSGMCEIRYTNPSAVTRAGQYALCSPINVSFAKGLTAPLTITAARPFSYRFTSSIPWNPPPAYSSPLPTITAAGTGTITTSTTGSTTHLVSTIASSGSITSVSITYPLHNLTNLYPYHGFAPSIALPVVGGVISDDGSNYLTLDGNGDSSDVYAKCNIFTRYAVNGPAGLAYDASNGFMYVADTVQNVVRKIILSTGVESIIAGGAVSSVGTISLDGFGTAAIIPLPLALALDPYSQLLYVSEQDTGSIRTINLLTLEVTTERLGTTDFTMQYAARGLAYNYAINALYIADYATGKIVSRDLVNHTDTDLLSGIPPPCALALDGANNKLYYSDDSDGDVKVLNLSTLVSTTLWSGRSSPLGLAIDAVTGVLYVSDFDLQTIYQLTLSPFAATLVAGSGSPGSADGAGPEASFNGPWGLVVDTVNSKLYVADNGNNTIRRISLTPKVVEYRVSTPATMGSTNIGLALDNTASVLYVSDFTGNTIRKFDIGTSSVTTVTSSAGIARGIALDSARTHLYTASFDGRICKVTTSTGAVVTLAGATGSSPEQDTIGLQPYGSIGVSDTFNVSACSSSGSVLAVGANGTIYVSVNSGTSWTAGTGLPGSGACIGLACSSDGSIMIAAISDYVLTSTDSGASWSLNTGSGLGGSIPSVWTGVAISSDGTTMYVSDIANGVIFCSTDTGASWASLTALDANAGGQFVVRDTGYVYIGQLKAGSSSGVVDSVNLANLTTGDPPSQYLVSSTVSNLNGISALPNFTGIAVTDSYGYIWTNFGGYSSPWTAAINAGYREWTGISCSTEGFIATSTTGIFMNPGFGTAWIQITAATMPGTSFASVALSPTGTYGIFTPSGASGTVYALATGQSARFYRPNFIARDSTDSYLYITDSPAGTIRQLTLATNSVSTIAYGFADPRGIVLDSTDTYAYIADDNRIIKMTLATGAYEVIAGSVTAGDTDGVGIDATFNEPTGLTLDTVHDVLYVTDAVGRKIRMITLSTATVVTIAGSGAASDTNGLGTAASFSSPTAVVVNSAYTTAYVASGGTVRAIDLTAYSTVATDVIGTIPDGYNAITLAGVTSLYNVPPTIKCTPQSDALTYYLAFNGGGDIPMPAQMLHEGSYQNTIQLIVNYTGLSFMSSMAFDYNGPIPIASINHPTPDTPLIRDNASSTELTPFIDLPGTDIFVLSATGFSYVPTPAPKIMKLKLQLFSGLTGDVFESYTNDFTVTPISLISTPSFAVPFTTYTYVPISYSFTAPIDVVDIFLDLASSSTNIKPYLASADGDTVVNFYSSTGLFTPLYNETITIYIYVIGVAIPVGFFTSRVDILLSSIVAIPEVPSGVPLNLYKYETFQYTFTLTGVGTPLILKYDRSSAQLAPYCFLSGDSASINFTGTPPASYSSTFYLVIDLMSGALLVNTRTYPVTISAGRIIVSPASPFTLYQYENTIKTFGTEPVFTVDPHSTTSFNSLFTTPTLPSGLSFSATNTLTGKPFTRQALRNYEVYGSNTMTGTIMTTALSIQVNPPIVRITPSAVAFSGLTTSSTPTATFTALLPDTNSYVGPNNFGYYWSTLPTGLFFTDNVGTPVPSGTFHPMDGSNFNTIKLAGTPTLTDIATFPSTGLVETVLTGTYNDSVAQATGTSTLSLQFAEAVGMTGTASSQLYVGKLLTTSDVVVTAQSYFPATSRISNFVASSLPAGLALASNSSIAPTRWWLTGRPTAASDVDYTFTATNSNAITASKILRITINPDTVSFTRIPANPIFIVSLPVTNGTFYINARAASGASITYTSDVDLTLYGLTLNPTTGYVAGIPTSSFGPAAPVVFTATDEWGSFATQTVLFTISEDTFTWAAYTPTFFQNKVLTPHQFIVTTTSGRTIQSFSSADLPPGLTLSPSGVLAGTFTGTTNTSFTITATTGYQPPSSASYIVTGYTLVLDNLLLVQTNGTDPVSNTFSGVQFQTIQYSSSSVVSPVYGIGNIYPLQYPSPPALTITSGGMLSGDFTAVPTPFPRYAVEITSSYAGVTNTRTAVMSLSNTPTPFTLTGWRLVNTTNGSNYSPLWSTSTYPFQVTAAGARSNVAQTWGSRRFSTGFPSTESIYPDFARNGTTFIAIDPSNVYEATFNTTTNAVGGFVSTLDGTGLSPPGPLGGISSDSVSNWMVVVKSTRITTFTRSANSGSWGTQWTDANSNFTNASSQSTLQYIAPNYVYGQFGNSAISYSNVLYSVDGKAWVAPATAPIFSNIYRFAVSNTTIVAVGSARATELGTDAPISVSTDSGVTWVTQTVDLSNLTGPSVVLKDIVYGNGRWVVCGIGSNTSNIIASSTNLTNWTIFPANNNIWSAIAVNANGWTIGGTYSASGVSASNSPRSTILSIDAAFSSNFTTSNSVFDYSSTPTYTSVFTRMLSTPFSNTSSFTGTITIPAGPLTFTQPTQSNLVLYQYVPYTITVQATGASGFLYYYAVGVPIGFRFDLNAAGTTASLIGTSPSNGTATITLYVKTATSAATRRQITFNTIIPFFVNPQSGAGAYTAILRGEVEANAAQNARDTRTFPQVDSLAGPLMAPRAPDVITQTNCFLGLCKKPCPTCRTMM